MGKRKCKCCGDEDCGLNNQGLCVDCASEIRETMETERAFYEEQNRQIEAGERRYSENFDE